MRYVSRQLQKAPNFFTSEAALSDRLMLAKFFTQENEILSQAEPPVMDFDLDVDEAVSALSALFKGKCSFCESRTYLNLHWFRPLSDAQPLINSAYAHLYYIWLRTDWSNLYLACNECGSSARRSFPVRQGKRGRLPTVDELSTFARGQHSSWPFEPNDKCLVIDPCRITSMVRHLSFSLNGELRPLSALGRATIDQFSLDRSSLQDARKKAFSSYVSLLDRALETTDHASAFDFEYLEFGGAWQLLMRRAVTFAGQKLGRRLDVSSKDLPKTVLKLWANVLGRETLLEGFNSIQHDLEKKGVRSARRNTVNRQLTSIKLENFKAIGSLEVLFNRRPAGDLASGRMPEATALVILGENAVGKSSVLEAVALAASTLKARANIGVAPSSFVLDPTLLGAMSGARALDALVTLQFEDGENTILRIGEQYSVEKAVGAIPPVFAYGAFRQYTARSSSRQNSGHIQSLFRTDLLLPNPEQWLLRLADDEFAMVARALKHIFVVEGEFDVIRRDMTNNRCLIVSRVGDNSAEVTTPLMSVSSGFRSVIGMVSDILAGMLKLQKKTERQSFAEFSSLILIDEIEAHLHPRWKMQIISALRRTFPASTILATTHDPLCLRGLHPDEVVVLRQTPVENPTSNELSIKVEKLTQLPNVENLTVEQLLTSDFFSMFSTDSAEVEERLARLGDLVSKQRNGTALDSRDSLLMDELRKEVVDVIPIGSTEVQRIILEAVHDYLSRRRTSSAIQLENLRKSTREAIIAALGDL